MRISDWSSDVCSSDLDGSRRDCGHRKSWATKKNGRENDLESSLRSIWRHVLVDVAGSFAHHRPAWRHRYLRSAEHTSELQSLMRISYAVFCLKKTKLLKIVHTNSQLKHKLISD